MTLAFTLMGNEIALLPKRAKNRDSEGMEIHACPLDIDHVLQIDGGGQRLSFEPSIASITAL